jgi:CheY-like chemotaxis protein
MESTNILIISYNPIVALVLSQEGFHNLVEATADEGLQIAAQNRPDLLLLSYSTFTSKHEDFLRLLKQMPSIRLVIVDFVYEHINSDQFQLFIDAGVWDCILPSPDEIKVSVKKVLSSENENTISTLPIIEKMLSRMKQLEEERNEIFHRMYWYEENQGRFVCNCDEIKSSPLKKQERPQSTAFNKLGRVYDGYYHGDAYSCDVCGTFWVCWHSGTNQQSIESWKVEVRNEFEIIS